MNNYVYTASTTELENFQNFQENMILSDRAYMILHIINNINILYMSTFTKIVLYLSVNKNTKNY